MADDPVAAAKPRRCSLRHRRETGELISKVSLEIDASIKDAALALRQTVPNLKRANLSETFRVVIEAGVRALGDQYGYGTEKDGGVFSG